MLKLSIITVNLNNAEGLRKTIDSVINQTYTNFEHIIIDGGSTDGSVEVIKEYEALYKEKQRHLYWVSEPDKGIYNGMNKGIKVAKGEYCLFLNSGDRLFEVAVLKNVFSVSPSDQILLFDVYVEKESGSHIANYNNYSLEFLSRKSICHQACLIKTELFHTIGYYSEKYKIASDYEFFIKAIYIYNSSVSYLPITLTIYDAQNGVSSNKTLEKQHQEERKFIQNSLLSPLIWEQALQHSLLIEKHNGLLSSGTVKMALKVSRLINLLKK